MEELVIKAKSGDLSALEDIFISMKNDLYKIAKTRFVNSEDAEDAVQETIVAVIKHIQRVDSIENFKPWVIKILINKCNTIYRKKKKTYISIDEMTDISEENKSIIDNDIDFYLMLNCLDYKEKLIIILFYSQDYTIKQISKVLNMNENTVKTKLSRAKVKIKNNYCGGKKEWKS